MNNKHNCYYAGIARGCPIYVGDRKDINLAISIEGHSGGHWGTLKGIGTWEGWLRKYPEMYVSKEILENIDQLNLWDKRVSTPFDTINDPSISPNSR